jgi:hypothetical protein
MEHAMSERNRFGLHGASGQDGSVLIFVIVALMLISALSVPLFRLASTSSFSDMDLGHQVQARYLARAGIHYADAWLCSGINTGIPTSGSHSVGDAGEFSLTSVVDNGGGNYTVTSRGTAHPSATFKAEFLEQRVISCGSTPQNTPSPADPGYYVVYSGGTGDFALPSGSTVDGSVYGKSITVGANSTITGDVISKTSVTLGSGVTVGGDVCSTLGDVTINAADITVGGEINAQGNVVMGSGATAEKSVHATGSVTLSPSGTSVLEDIHAGGGVSIGSGCLANQNVFAGGTLQLLSSGSRVKEDAHAGGNVVFGWSTRVDEDVWAGGAIQIPRYSVGNIGGIAHENQSSPPRILPTAPETCPDVSQPQMQTFTAGGSTFTVAQSSSRTITPGTYGNLSFGGGSTLTIQAGTCSNVGDSGCYYLSKFDGGKWGQTLRLDLSTGNEIVIFSVGEIKHSGQVQVSTDGTTWQSISSMDADTAKELAKRVYWETQGSFTGNLSSGSCYWFGTVLAKNNITLPSGATVIGALATVNGIFSVGANPNITYVLANFASLHW